MSGNFIRLDSGHPARKEYLFCYQIHSFCILLLLLPQLMAINLRLLPHAFLVALWSTEQKNNLTISNKCFHTTV